MAGALSLVGALLAGCSSNSPAGSLQSGRAQSGPAQSAGAQNSANPGAEEAPAREADPAATEPFRLAAAATESALSERLTLLASLANDCDACAAALDAAASAASDRLIATGGLDRLGDASGVPAPPYAPVALAEYMARSALAELELLAHAGGVDPNARAALAGLAVGRLISAELLRQTFPAADETLPAGAVPSYEWADELLAGTAGDSPDIGDPDAANSALQIYDCVASAILMGSPQGIADRDEQDAVAGRARQISTRANALIAAGVSGARAPRCAPASYEATALATELLQADLLLFTSEDLSARELGASWAASDARTFAKAHPKSAPTVSPLPFVEAEAAQSE